MVDRLADLGIDRTHDDHEAALRTPLAGELEVADGFMTHFFDDVGRIKAKMALMRRNVKLMEQKHQSALTSITMDQGKNISEEIDAATDETNKLAQEVRQMLKVMEERNKEVPPDKQGTSEDRIRKNMQGTLARKFLEVMKEYQDVQQKYKERYRDRMQRQYKIVHPTATQDEIETVLASGQPVFSTPVLTTGQQVAMNALAEIQEKHQDILKLERSLEELHQLFVDMSILVETQGELLNQIEYSVEASVAYTDKGVVELKKAQEYQKSARKKMCIIVCCLVVLFGVIFAALGGMKIIHT